MTLAEARTKTRRILGLSTVDQATSDLDAFIAEAEVSVAADALEINPWLAYRNDIITVAAPFDYITMNDATLPNLNTGTESGRDVFKIARLATRSAVDDNTVRLVSSSVHPQEWGGSGTVNDKGPHYPTSLRYAFDGLFLHFYPKQTSETIFDISYTRVPVAQTDAASAILRDFGGAISGYLADLVCYRAAAAARAAWGLSPYAELRHAEELWKERAAKLRLMQQQEPDVTVGTRWPLA